MRGVIHELQIASLPLLMMLVPFALPAQVLTNAVVTTEYPATPSSRATTADGAVSSAPANAVLPLAAPVKAMDMRPEAAPSAKLKLLAIKYDVSQIGTRNIGAGMNFYSLEREIAMGRELSQEVEEQSKLLTDPVITAYINRLGQQLVRNSDAKVPFSIKVIDSDEVNAFALPGGFFYVNTGLILAADNEAELAGVMAHEIAHVAARHATRNATKSDVWNIASIPLVFVAGPAGMAARSIANVAAPMSFLKFNRDAEREADLLGIEYAYECGYDPRAMVDLFERLDGDAGRENKGAGTKTKRPGMLAKAFATHPMTSDRIERARQEIAYILPPRDSYVETTSDFDQIKARLISLQWATRLHVQPGKPVLRVRDKAAADAANNAPPEDGPVLRRKPSN